MNYSELEKYFKNEEGLNMLTGECEQVFDEIDLYAEQFQDGSLSSSSDIKKAITRLAGFQMYLEPIYHEASTNKKFYQEARYANLRKESAEKNEKFVSTVADKQASLYVYEYRKLRNRLEAKIKACTVGINTCQSLLKYISEEMRMSK